MAKTYTLTGTLNTGYLGYGRWTDSNWNGYATANSSHLGKAGRSGDYFATNIVFNSSTLSSLRSKTVSSVKLKLTLTHGTVYTSDYWAIGYKLNSLSTGAYNQQVWTRSDKDSTAASATIAAGYVKNSTKLDISGATTLTLTMANTVPKYGYVIGPPEEGLAQYAYLLITAAVLEVTTNETDYTLSLSYNANSGSGAPSAQTSSGTTTGTPSATFTISSTKPTRTGYTFLGWGTSSTATSASYQPGGSITISSNTTLYAVWKIITYTVSYNKGSNGSGTNTSATKTYGVNLTLSGAIFTRTGYTQTGWSTSDGGSLAYSLGATYSSNAAVTLYPFWTINTWAVSYNKGSYGNGTNTSDTKTYNVTLTLKGAIFTRTGYTQTGWSTSDGGSKAYNLSGSYTSNSAVTLYPFWTINTYTISYNKGANGTGTNTSDTKTYGTNLTLKGAIFTRTGYTQTGWSTSDGGSKAYNLSASYSTNAAATLYPFWSINTWTVSYNANGGSGAPSAQTKTYNVTLTLSSTIPTRTGYNFLGWSTSSTATSATYSAGGSYTANSGATLYAVWQQITYTVSYNKGSNGTGTNTSATKTYGTALTLRGATFTRTGYYQSGWATSDGGSQAYALSASYTTEASVTLYPVWTAYTVTVQYNANGGSLADTHASGFAIDSSGYITSNGSRNFQVLSYGASTDPWNYNNPSGINIYRTGYNVPSGAEWNTAADGTGTSFNQDSNYTATQFASNVTTGNRTIVLYCNWTTNVYTISYNANGGTGAPSSQSKTYGVNLTLSSTKPTRTGYTFLGWSTSSTAATATYSAGGTYTANESATLYAVWQIITYSVTYNANGGSGAPASQTKTYGVDLTLSSTVPTRTGYTFLGWGTSASATSASYQPGAKYTANAALPLYAVWQIITYSISYNANGGSGAPSAQTKTYGVNLTLSSTVPVREGYDFLGWDTSSTAKTPTYQPGGTYTANSAAILYAIWKRSAFIRVMGSDGNLKSIPLYIMTSSGLKELTLYKMGSDGTLKQQE